MNPMMQQAMMQQMQQAQGQPPMAPQQGGLPSPWMGMQGQQDPSMMQGGQNPMEGQMLAQGFPAPSAGQQQVADFFKPKPKPSAAPQPGKAPYQGLTPTMVDQLEKFKQQSR